MTQRREATKALETPLSPGHPEAHTLVRSLGGDVSVRELLVTGALRGFTPEQLLSEVAA